MKNTLKKTIATIGLLSMVIGLTACGSVNCRFCGFPEGRVVEIQMGGNIYHETADSGGCVSVPASAQSDCIADTAVV